MLARRKRLKMSKLGGPTITSYGDGAQVLVLREKLALIVSILYPEPQTNART